MCNHYRNDIRKGGLGREIYGFEEFSETRLRFDNMPADIYPDYEGLVIRRRAPTADDDAALQLTAMRWGFPPPPNVNGPPVTNVRNLQSSYWRGWLKPAQRCLVPFTSFSEWTVERPKRQHWFAMADGSPACFAGIWRPWSGTRGTKKAPIKGDHLLYAFLTCDPNGVVAPIHPKAMPVILPDRASQQAWLEAPTDEALQLARPLSEDRLIVLPDPPPGQQGLL